MASSSSQPIPLNIYSKKSLQIKPKSSTLRADDLNLIIEQIVDFKSFVANGYPLSENFEKQGWMNFFHILNGPMYLVLVKNFWFRAETYDEYASQAEERIDVENDKSLKGKSISEMRLKEFKGIEIRSTVMGIEVSITQDNIAKLIGVDNRWIVKLNSKDETLFSPNIKENIFELHKDYGKVKNMHLECILLFKIIISYLLPKDGSSDKISLGSHTFYMVFGH